MFLLPLVFVAGAAAPAFAGETPGRATTTGATARAATHATEKADPDASAGDEKKGAAHKPALRGVVNLNTADAATLELLPGVGEKKADRILDYRHKHPFKKVEEITKVKGFGRKTLVKLKPYLTLTGPSTLGEGGGLPTE
jgi:competence protein ComEA